MTKDHNAHINAHRYRRISTMLKLREKLKTIIQTKGLTIAGLSRSTGVPLQTIHGWLKGNKPRDIEQVKTIAKELGVSLDFLCFGEELREPSKVEDHLEEINAGVFEVILRRIKDE